MKMTSLMLTGAIALTCHGVFARPLAVRGAHEVSQVSVAAVVSTTGGRESAAGRASTRVHHGGAFVRVTTIERGMGRATATMNGALLREVSTANVCDRGGGLLGACRNGQTVQGHLRVWDATGKGNGTFSVRVTSNDWPRNTVSSSLSIW